MKFFLSLVISFLLISMTPVSSTADHPTVPEMVKKMRQRISRVRDMKCIFIKKIVKAGKTLPEAQMEMKFLSEPKSIFLEFITPHQGQKCLYVKGSGEEKIIVRPSGGMSFMNLKLDPEGEAAMKENLNPMTEMDFHSIVNSFESYYRDSLTDKSLHASVEMNIEEEEGPVLHLLRIDSDSQTENYLHLYINRDTLLPYRVRYKINDDRAVYTYRDVMTNTDIEKEAFGI